MQPMIRPLLTICGAALVSTLSLAAAQAQTSADSVRLFVQREAGGIVPAGSGSVRVDVTVGRLDPRLQLAPCTRSEPFIPTGARLWGRAHVGLRCVEGANWSVLLPVTVRIYGPALVAARPLTAQAPLGQDDVQLADVEWTREPQGVVTDMQQLTNRVLQRPIATGQPIALSALRAPVVIAQGDPVKLVGTGQNFSISAQAIALGSAQDGHSVRVRTESGRILSGTARGGRVVDVSF